MKTIQLIVTLSLALLALTFLSLAQEKPVRIQYYWVTPNTVYLWRASDDRAHLTATFDEGQGGWTFAPEEDAGQWQDTLTDLARKSYPNTKINDERLPDLMLAKLANESAVRWATRRVPVEIYLRQPNDKTVEVAFLSKERSALKPEGYAFNLKGNVQWVKSNTAGDIPLGGILGIDDKPEAVRKAFDLPDPQPPLGADAAWADVWDKLIKKLTAGEAATEITYQDKNNAGQWIRFEKLGPTDKLPTTVKTLVRPAHRDEPKPVITVPPRDYWRIISIIGIPLLGIILAALIYRFRKLISSKFGAASPDKPLDTPHAPEVSPSALISPAGLDLLHQLATEQYKKELRGTDGDPSAKPQDGDVRLVEYLLGSFEWVHREYLDIVGSPEFQQKSDQLKANVIKNYYQDWGVEEKDQEKVKVFISRGRAAESSILRIRDVHQLSGVREVVNKLKSVEFRDAEDWLSHWPDLLTEFNALLQRSREETNGFRNDLKEKNRLLEGKEDQQKREWEKREKLLISEHDEKIKTWQQQFRTLKGNNDTLNLDLVQANLRIRNLESELEKMTKAKEAAEAARVENKNALEKYEDKVAGIQEVQKLSLHLRQWIQGYFNVQHKADGEMRAVGLLAALINYSLYQICFSIIDDRLPLRKAMAQNLLRFSQHFSRSSNYVAAQESLARIDSNEGVSLNDCELGVSTIDDRLFQAFLSKLKDDTGQNFGPFFIDERENKITRVNAS